MAKNRIVFVCAGNTCRSAMAQFILRAMLKERENKEISVTSCGLAPDIGSPMNPMAVEVLKSHGVKVGAHKAKKWSSAYAKEGTLVITATRAHKQHLPYGNVYSLGELTDGRDVEDPFGGSAESYVQVYGQLEEQLRVFAAKVLD